MMGTGNENSKSADDSRESEATSHGPLTPVGKPTRGSGRSKTAKSSQPKEKKPLTEQSVSRSHSKGKIEEARLVETRNLINEKVNAVSARDLEETCRIGQHVIDNYFDGTYASAIDQSGHKDISLRKICRKITADRCAVKRSWLTEAVHLTAQQRQLPAEVVEGLGKGHMQALLMLPSLEDRVSWASAARRDGLCANELKRQIRDELKDAKPDEGEGANQKKRGVDEFFKALENINKQMLKLVSEDTGEGIIDLNGIEPAQAAQILTGIGGLQNLLGTLRSQVASKAVA